MEGVEEKGWRRGREETRRWVWMGRDDDEEEPEDEEEVEAKVVDLGVRRDF